MADQVREETPAEEALRSLACWLGVGGYNAPTVDAKVFEAKIREGVTTYMPLHGMAARDLAEMVLSLGMVTPRGVLAKEMARRVLGIVPLAATASHAAEVETLRALLKSLADEFCRVYPIYYYAEPWGHNTNGPLLAARAALKGDKP